MVGMAEATCPKATPGRRCRQRTPTKLGLMRLGQPWRVFSKRRLHAALRSESRHGESNVGPLLANRRPPIVRVSILLGPRSLNDLAYQSLDLATGTAVARAETTCSAASSRWIYEVGLGRSHCAGSAQSRQHRYARGLGHRCRGQRSSSVRPRGHVGSTGRSASEGKELTKY